MSRYVFDIETDGLLDTLTQVHSICLKDIDTGEVLSCMGDVGSYPQRKYITLERGLELLTEAELIVGHNVIKFDIPALQKVFPRFKPKGTVRDTLVLSRLIKADIGEDDWSLVKKQKLPGNLRGHHSLESWGYRLGKWKGDYAAVKEAEAKALGIKDKAAITRYVWGTWNTEMQDYCEQDVVVTAELYAYFLRKLEQGWSAECVEIEHETAWLIARQERYGCGFDTQAAALLYAALVDHLAKLDGELQTAFPPKVVKTIFVPKVNNKTRGYVKGVPFEKVQSVPFNPGSRQQIAERLQELGWEPTEYGKDGVPTCDDETLESLPWPEAKLLAKRQLVAKRMGLLATGKQALMRHEKNGRIYGECNPGGTVTRRMTHKIVANIPGVVDKRTGKPQEYGREFRALFTSALGPFVGCDADSLEGRVMAHFVARYDGGDFGRTLLEGDKSKGTDLHSRNAKALAKWGMKREGSKEWFYAMIYGARNPKLAEIMNIKGSKAVRDRVGGEARKEVMKEHPALAKLIEAVQGRAKQQGWLKAIDGGKLRVRSIDAALNTLFQSTGAIVMKKAAIILDERLSGVLPSVIGRLGPEAATKLTPGKDYEFSITYHDEWQIDTKPEHTNTVATEAPAAIVAAGEHFNFRCPLKGNADIGNNWAETH